ncbi:hypothetical protein HQ47_09805 [Porphyromonas macacae]|uniref:Lipoprotein NlpI n=1 Tax=Porphyromonas macacae TaxID=28115 RepID=A0A0A2E0S7_9PORP|nr:tetratricopeptide repeat protein [Porphyromonas macacae]KGN72513.1 hypothetical protein HQ47_09805 [Porphyromonas macacae]SUB89863.1 lipoprotein NlpI [Porphyromonas macacae]
MKKVIYALGLAVIASGSAFAQNENVKTAEHILKSSNPNFKEARTLISAAKTNPETQNSAKAWYIAGAIENGEFETLNLQSMLPNATVDKNVMYDALMNVLPNYIVADSLDHLPNEKGKVKPKFEKAIKKDLKTNHLHLINAGAHYMNENAYAKAMKAFEQFLEIKKLPMFESDKEMTAIDSNTMVAGFYGAVSAYQAKDFDGTIKMCERIKDVDYQKNDVYQLWATAYLGKTDTVSYLRILDEGAKIFPQEKFYLLNIANTYIQQGKMTEAIAKLNDAIKMDPQNPQLYDVMGKLYEEKEDFDNAEIWFKKALEVDPNYAEAIYDMARTYYNRGILMKNSEKISAETEAKAKEWFQKSLPLMEKAYESLPNETWYVLSSLYYNLGMNDKSEALKAKHSN